MSIVLTSQCQFDKESSLVIGLKCETDNFTFEERNIGTTSGGDLCIHRVSGNLVSLTTC